MIINQILLLNALQIEIRNSWPDHASGKHASRKLLETISKSWQTHPLGLCKKLVCINKLSIQSIQSICTCTLVECQERSPWNYFWIIPHLGEIQTKSPHVYHGMCMIFLPFLSPTPILSNHMWVQGMELVILPSWTRTACWTVPFWDLLSLMTVPQESFMKSPDLGLEVNSSEILGTKKYCVGGGIVKVK